MKTSSIYIINCTVVTIIWVCAIAAIWGYNTFFLVNLPSNPDGYKRTSPNSFYDQDCKEIGISVLERLDVYYPKGFICSSWLAEENYPSKSKCSCYRGRTGELEVVTYYRSSGEVIRVNSRVNNSTETVTETEDNKIGEFKIPRNNTNLNDFVNYAKSYYHLNYPNDTTIGCYTDDYTCKVWKKL